MTGTESGGRGRDAFGLTGLVGQPLRRVLVRRRESQVTTSAWRLDVTCNQGEGGIVRVEADQVFHRGDGVFLGWTQALRGDPPSLVLSVVAAAFKKRGLHANRVGREG